MGELVEFKPEGEEIEVEVPTTRVDSLMYNVENILLLITLCALTFVIGAGFISLFIG
jgi:hypothetical protein